MLHSSISKYKSLLNMNVKGCKKCLLPCGISWLESLQTLKLKGVEIDKKLVANAFRWTNLQGFPNLLHLSTTFNGEFILQGFLMTLGWRFMIELRVLSLQFDDSLGQWKVERGKNHCVKFPLVNPIPKGMVFMKYLETLNIFICKEVNCQQLLMQKIQTYYNMQ